MPTVMLTVIFAISRFCQLMRQQKIAQPTLQREVAGISSILVQVGQGPQLTESPLPEPNMLAPDIRKAGQTTAKFADT